VRVAQSSFVLEVPGILVGRIDGRCDRSCDRNDTSNGDGDRDRWGAWRRRSADTEGECRNAGTGQERRNGESGRSRCLLAVSPVGAGRSKPRWLCTRWRSRLYFLSGFETGLLRSSVPPPPVKTLFSKQKTKQRTNTTSRKLLESLPPPKKKNTACALAINHFTLSQPSALRASVQ
jgi:hypothetical protein